MLTVGPRARSVRGGLIHTELKLPREIALELLDNGDAMMVNRNRGDPAAIQTAFELVGAASDTATVLVSTAALIVASTKLARWIKLRVAAKHPDTQSPPAPALRVTSQSIDSSARVEIRWTIDIATDVDATSLAQAIRKSIESTDSPDDGET